jgi:hypothetical protein
MRPVVRTSLAGLRAWTDAITKSCKTNDITDSRKAEPDRNI